MRCEEIMKRDVHCVSADSSVQEAAQSMRARNIGFMPVCDAKHVVIGTITDRDLTLRVLADGQPASTRIVTVMTRDVISCQPSDDLKKAQELMGTHHKSRMVCVDPDGRLAGVLSLSDIAQCSSGVLAARTLQQVSEREAQ